MMGPLSPREWYRWLKTLSCGMHSVSQMRPQDVLVHDSRMLKSFYPNTSYERASINLIIRYDIVPPHDNVGVASHMYGRFVSWASQLLIQLNEQTKLGLEKVGVRSPASF